MAQEVIPNGSFSLKITGDGINVDRLIDGQTVASVMAVVMGLNKPATDDAVIDYKSDPSVEGATQRISLREFLDDVDASHKPDLIVAIGHYMMQFEGKSDFSREDVKVRFSTAREPMPANFWRDFSNAERKGMLARVHASEGQYYITKKGLAALSNKFAKGKAN